MWPFKKKPKSRWSKYTNENPRHFDCRDGGWGNHCSWGDYKDSKFDILDGPDAGTYIKVSGHLTPRVRLGDFIIKSFSRGPAKFVIVEVNNCSDPEDMFFATMGYVDHVNEADIGELVPPAVQQGPE